MELTKQQITTFIFLALAMLVATTVVADNHDVKLSDIEVISTTPLHGVGLPADQIASRVISVTAEDIARSQSLDISDFLNKTLGSVSINSAQNNPFQPDLQFRGFTASPLVGVAQGLSFYQDGVRVNEPFGDAVNFELIPQSAIASMNVMPGSNPLFGLNTLGGAVSVQTKNGFDHEGHSLEAYRGSFNRRSMAVESGGNNGKLGYFITGARLKEDGWRDKSPSDVEQLFAKLSYRSDTAGLDLSITEADSDLNGNGAVPIELAKRDKRAVFTHPDNTKNDLLMFTLNGDRWLSDSILLSVNMYHRNNDRKTFNGDDSELTVINNMIGEDENGDGSLTGDEIVHRNAAALGFSAADDDDDDDDSDSDDDDDDGPAVALNNVGKTEQEGAGLNAQLTFLNQLFNRENQFIVGASYDYANMEYKAHSEIAHFTASRGTRGTGAITADSIVNGDIDSDTLGIYFTDTLSVTDQLALTLSARYNLTHIDISGTSRNGTVKLNESGKKHTFRRVNPAVGVTYNINDDLNVFGSYSQSSRAPTPSELACSNKAVPCALPNSFLSDPLLDQVVARTWEAGLRGAFGQMGWVANVFHTVNHDDIIFLPTERNEATGNRNNGYFDNVGKTRRMGIELGLQGNIDKLTWFTQYSLVDATFQSKFSVHNANNPAGALTHVKSGDTMPGIPKHNVSIGADYAVTPDFSVGFDASYHSSQYYRGDEANNNKKLAGYRLVNMHARYTVSKHVELFAKADNVFDSNYQTFGLYGEPDEVPGLGHLKDNRFVGWGAPRAGWVGIKVSI